jgi:hypothetical protein
LQENTMADSTLDPDNTPEPDRKLGRGKGTSALGPGDISDSGSDVQGGLRRTGEVGLGLDTGTNEDPDSVSSDPSAGPDIGDAMLDSDTDAMGTGERATAGRDHELAGSDIDIDRIEDITPDDNPDLDDLEHPDSRARQARDANRPAPRR